jgi:hypothetical protein
MQQENVADFILANGKGRQSDNSTEDEQVSHRPEEIAIFLSSKSDSAAEGF